MKILFLAADTIRSRSYAQYLQNANIRLAKTIVISSISSQYGQQDIQGPPSGTESDLLIPDYRIQLHDSIQTISEVVVTISSNTINTPEVERELVGDFDIAIYSGFGGEIVSQTILDISPPMLHIHAGLLPKYRGSTTFYYSIIQGNKEIGVSAIFLEQDIDTGEILYKRSFSLPSSSCTLDIDYYYDPMMRSQCLIECLQLLFTSAINIEKNPKPKLTEYFFIMHPVLRHIAIGKLQQTLHIPSWK